MARGTVAVSGERRPLDQQRELTQRLATASGVFCPGMDVVQLGKRGAPVGSRAPAAPAPPGNPAGHQRDGAGDDVPAGRGRLGGDRRRREDVEEVVEAGRIGGHVTRFSGRRFPSSRRSGIATSSTVSSGRTGICR
jgi:hypothetical protein